MHSMTLFYCLGIFFGVIFFLSSIMVSCWITVKHRKGSITDEKPKEMIHLQPQEDSGVRPQTLQTNQENSRGWECSGQTFEILKSSRPPGDPRADAEPRKSQVFVPQEARLMPTLETRAQGVRAVRSAPRHTGVARDAAPRRPAAWALDACGEPPKYETMALRDSPKKYYEVGEEVYYQCYPGYLTLRSVVTYCEQNHSWYPLEEACFRKECNTPGLENGEVFAPNYTFQFDSEAYFYCNEGYYLSGKKALLCELRGDDVFWSDEFPKCYRIYCKPPAKIKNGKYTNSHRTIFEYNELITFSCNPSQGPDEFSLVGNSKLICVDNNKWSSSPPECKVVKCDYPVVEHGRLVSGIRDKYSYQAVVLFECLPGFYLNGSNPVFCGGRSTWEPVMPKCVRGYPEPKDPLILEDFEELDAGIIAVIVLTIPQGFRCVRAPLPAQPVPLLPRAVQPQHMTYSIKSKLLRMLLEGFLQGMLLSSFPASSEKVALD
ncbi:membrane cofactor protein isoform X4 [Callorhinus ursinus]|uniref:Membrane cofactor protein n=1 Tax=Callorhinus ursinus TaxID=34884 RepID=A0A3Q7NJR5_CALUR|nr:membrane cofactor protein isoform X4 [Callorhinus ursinus]